MNEMEIMQGLAKIIVFLLMFFAFFLLTLKTQKRAANIYLASFLILTAFDLSTLFLYKLFGQFHLLLSIKNASTLLLMPFFFFYVQATISSKYKLNWNHILHLLPFLIFFLGHLFRIEFLLKLYLFVSEVQFIIYILWVIIILLRYKRLYLENYTNYDDIDYRWLMQITIAFLIAHIFVYVKLISYFLGTQSDYTIAQLIVTFSAFVVTCWLVLKALYRPEIFRGISPDIVPVSELADKFEVKKALSKEAEIRKVKDFMSKEEPFLNPKLTIKELAQQLDFPEKDLSVLINQHMNKHFFDFVNEFRIEKAKECLVDSTKKEYTILEILYEVGFNSKSSFNTAFKKYTGQTPSAYRKSRV